MIKSIESMIEHPPKSYKIVWSVDGKSKGNNPATENENEAVSHYFYVEFGTNYFSVISSLSSSGFGYYNSN